MMPVVSWSCLPLSFSLKSCINGSYTASCPTSETVISLGLHRGWRFFSQSMPHFLRNWLCWTLVASYSLKWCLQAFPIYSSYFSVLVFESRAIIRLLFKLSLVDRQRKSQWYLSSSLKKTARIRMKDLGATTTGSSFCLSLLLSSHSCVWINGWRDIE